MVFNFVVSVISSRAHYEFHRHVGCSFAVYVILVDQCCKFPSPLNTESSPSNLKP